MRLRENVRIANAYLTVCEPMRLLTSLPVGGSGMDSLSLGRPGLARFVVI